jgi:hypothetical protein
LRASSRVRGRHVCPAHRRAHASCPASPTAQVMGHPIKHACVCFCAGLRPKARNGSLLSLSLTNVRRQVAPPRLPPLPLHERPGPGPQSECRFGWWRCGLHSGKVRVVWKARSGARCSNWRARARPSAHPDTIHFSSLPRLSLSPHATTRVCVRVCVCAVLLRLCVHAPSHTLPPN